jgi:hypothetical protein
MKLLLAEMAVLQRITTVLNGFAAKHSVLLVMLAEAHNRVNFLLQLFYCFATLV